MEMFDYIKQEENKYIDEFKKECPSLSFNNEQLLRVAHSVAAQKFYNLGFNHGVSAQEKSVQQALGLTTKPILN
jgi:hypothetical protein